MAEYNVEAFRSLIKAAIGDRTQSDFARDAGLTPQYLNRLLNSDDIGRPTKTTLAKLAGHSYTGIPLAKFLQACGYDDADEELKKELRSMPIKDRIKSGADKFLHMLNSLSANNAMYESLYAFANTVISECPDESISVSIGSPVELPKGEIPNAELASIATFSWGDDYHVSMDVTGFDVELDVLICYSETKGGSVIICDVKTDQKTLYNYDSKVVGKLIDGNMFNDAGTACIITRKLHQLRVDPETAGMSAEERLLHNIFGSTTASSRIVQEEGYGFYIDHTPLYVLYKFIENRKSVLNMEVTVPTITEDERNSMDEYGIPVFDDIGCIVSDIISKESGIRMSYSYDPNVVSSSRPVIMFPAKSPWNYTDYEKELSESGLKQVLDRYARELRSEVEYCVVQFEIDEDYRI
jgi:transcriptional regulator with XRE-family HTH domain